MLSAMQYPYWLMVAGAALVVLGFIGFAFSQNKNGATVDERTHGAEWKAKGK
jgi:type VI protein secretion system component VasF